MPYCSPHGFAALWICHCKLMFRIILTRKTDRVFICRPQKSSQTSASRARQELKQVSLSHLASQCAAAFRAETGKYNLFELSHICTASDNKEEITLLTAQSCSNLRFQPVEKQRQVTTQARNELFAFCFLPFEPYPQYP